MMGGLSMDVLASSGKRFGPNDKIRLGVIGCNGMGFNNLVSMLKQPEVELVALCDVDRRVLARRSGELENNGLKKPRWYKDYRRMLDQKDIDIVIIGTPDHWHCLQLCDALDAGKDVYCEKPLANSIEECRIIIRQVEKSNQIVQIGQWQRSQPHFVEAIDFVHSGALGEIRLAKAWAYQGWMMPVDKKPDSTVPEGVDYDMWLGPAPKRAFNQNRFHFNFRWFWDYAGGLMTDWGVHLIDYALYGLKAGIPNSVMATGGKFAYPNDASETPDTLQTVFEYDQYSILWEHATGINGGNYGRDHGIAFIGNNGTLVLDRKGWEVIPENDFQGWDKKGSPRMEQIPLQPNTGGGFDLHMKNFIEAVKSRDAGSLNAPVKVGYDAALVCHMGNVAYKTGAKVKWSNDSMSFASKKANSFIETQYHNGWKLPGS
jgi:predicted dehydrogenase